MVVMRRAQFSHLHFLKADTLAAYVVCLEVKGRQRGSCDLDSQVSQKPKSKTSLTWNGLKRQSIDDAVAFSGMAEMSPCGSALSETWQQKTWPW